MSETPTTQRPALTVRRTLVVVAIAVAVAILVRALGGVAVFAWATSTRDPSNPFAGIGIALIGVVVISVAGSLLSIVVVAVGLRGRWAAARFTGLFALILVVGIVLSTGYLLPAAQNWWPVFVPLLWAAPAAAVGILRVRWLLVVLAAGVAVSLGITGVQAFAGYRQQQDANASFSGPVYAPSRAPASPLPGYRLRAVDLPNEYESRVELLYISEGASVSDRKTYSIVFTEGTKELLCGGQFAACPEVGRALGVPVLFNNADGTYYVSLHGGVLALQTYESAASALTILRDLHPSTVDRLAQLKVDKL